MENVDTNPNRPRSSTNALNREAFRKLKNKNKFLETRLQQLRDENLRLKDENLALRENNIKFQVENYKLHKSIKKFELKNKFEEHFRNFKHFKQEIEKDKFQEVAEDSNSDCFENDVFEIIEDENGYESDGNESFDINYENPDELGESYECNDILEEEPNDVPVPMEIPDKLEDNANKIDQIPAHTPNRIAITRSHFKNLCNHLEDLKEGKKNDAFFVYKLMEIFFDRETLISCNNAAKTSDYKYKGISLLDPVKIKLMRKMLADRIDNEDNIDEIEKRERMKKFYSYINIKIFNSTKKKQQFFRRSVSESGYL